MRPIRLEVEGLFSYVERQILDFEKLSENHLFGVFGAVGSGKSALLEAITFALFGETERLGSKDGRAYNMLNLKAKEMWISFEFGSGVPEKKYRFTAKVRRNAKRHEATTTPERAGYIWEKGEWVPLPHSDAAEIIGLSYTHFRRAIIIPQGKFAEFLHLVGKERTEMMQKIFQLERFDLSKKAGALDAETTSALTLVEGQLQAIPPVGDEEIPATEEALRQEEEKSSSLSARKLQAQETVNRLQRIRDLHARWEDLERTQQNLLAQKEEMEDLDRQLQTLDQTQKLLGEVIPIHDRLHAQVSASHDRMLELDSRLQRESEALAQASLAFSALDIPYQTRHQLKERAADLRKIIRILALEAELGNLSGRIQAGKLFREESEKKLEVLRSSAKEIADHKESLTSQMTAKADLVALEAWYKEQTRLLTERESAQMELQSLENQISETEAALSSQESELISLALPWIPAPQLESLEEALEAKRDQLRRQSESTQEAALLAARLEEGKPCPVCGSPHHPHPALAATHSAEGETPALIAAIRTLREGLRTLAAKRQTLAHAQAVHTRTRETLLVREAELARLRTQFHWNFAQPDRPDCLPALFAPIQKAENDRKILLQKEEALQHEVQSSTELLKKAGEKLAQLENQEAACQSEKQSLTQNLLHLSLEEAGAKEAEFLESEARKSEEEVAHLEEAYQAAQSAEQIARAAVQETQSNLATERKIFLLRKEELSQALGRITEGLHDLALPDLASARDILARGPKLEAGRKGLDTWRLALRDTATALQTLAEQGPRQSFHPEELESALLATQHLETAILDAQQAIGRLRNQIADLRERAQKRALLALRHRDLSIRKQNITEIRGLFEGLGFVNYISGVFLEELVARANERFRILTRNTLHLELSTDRTLWVRDYLNGGELRLAKTLSGGQTFKASLSLALALSDSIASRAPGIGNFFFLDEGFGTLDKESLAIVFETLKSLRKENRVVGVISHVEELQQEIETYLHIWQDEKGASHIQPSWEE